MVKQSHKHEKSVKSDSLQISLAHKITWFLVFIACLIMGGVLSLHFGQDASFDLRNYHLYNAWAWWNDRYRSDLFVAGIQSFFSPYLDLIYFVLAKKIFEYHPLVLGFLAGWPYGCFVFVMLLLARKVAEVLGIDKQGRISYGIFLAVAVGLGVTGAAAWSQIGLTTNELTFGAITNLGFYFIIKNMGFSGEWKPGWREILMAGSLYGIAAGLKLTACVYAPGAALVFFALEKTWRSRFMSALLFSVSWLVWFSLLYGPWALHLYRLTGNPFFPMFNNIFHSPWANDSAAIDTRFLPKTTLQALFYPFYWMFASARPKISELRFQDPRMAFAYIAVMLIVGTLAITKIKKRPHHASILIWATTFYFVVSYVIWQTLFSIMRYYVSLEAVGAILIAVAIFEVAQLAPHQLRKVTFLLVSIVTIGTAVLSTRYPNWGHVPYARKVFVYSAPDLPRGALLALASQPTGYAAVLMGSKEPSLHFLGLPTYFDNKFAHTELMHQVMHRIKRYRRNEFVAYSVRSPPPISRMDFVGLRMELNQCRDFSSNLGSPLRICKAAYDQKLVGKLSAARVLYRLSAIPLSISANTQLNISLTLRCSSRAQLGSAVITWAVERQYQGPYRLYVSPFERTRALVASGGSKGRAMALGWVRSGDRFILTNDSGKVLASQEVGYTACKHEHGQT